MIIIKHTQTLKVDVPKYLTQSELAKYSALLLKYGNRAKSWLSGRIAAKAAIRDYYYSQKVKIPYWKDIVISNKNSGQPYFIITNPSLKDYSKETAISISHNEEYALAEIGNILKDGLVGIDIERLRSFSNLVIENFLAPSEKKFIQSLREEERDFHTTLIWSYKEAYLKARGLGLRKRPDEIQIDHNTETGGYFLRDGSKNYYSLSHKHWQGGPIITKVTIPN